MSLRLAILGATGSVGQAIAAHVLRSRLLRPGDRLQLVGRDTEEARRHLFGLAIDLQDAFDDLHVPIEIAGGLDQVEADMVVVAAGETVSPDRTTRQQLGDVNAPLFEHIGRICGARLPDALFVVVSNPVELAVTILARHIDRHRVIGMGAQQDSLRFARAIAARLGLCRHDVEAMAVGEHGGAMVPLWSRVRLVGHARARTDLQAALDALRAEAVLQPLAERVAALRETVSREFHAGRVAAAYEATARALPDERIFVEPFLTTWCVHSTAQATANATLQMIAAASGRHAPHLNGQVLLDGETLGIVGVCGLPVRLDRTGWTLDDPERFDHAEQAMIRDSADAIARFIAGIAALPDQEAGPA
ncbi:MAG: lactate/malate family dehydrogenase [Janthinobacterium lividum]